jgi:UDP-N-acetylmuramyl tripeptide synthase
LRNFLTICLGKFVRWGLRAFTKSSGSALPGRIVEKIDPYFLRRMCDKLPFGVVLVSGTNGKTTTTHIITELLEGQGLKVFTNKTGSNFARGVISELLEQVSLSGNIAADIAVLELDEAYGVQFADIVQPDYSLFLNVMRDQLDRFGELDYTASLLAEITAKTKKCVILNSADPHIYSLKDSVQEGVKVKFFGLHKKMRPFFLNDEELYSKTIFNINQNVKCEDSLIEFNSKSNVAKYKIGEAEFQVKMKLRGLHNIYNTVAAITTVKSILENKIDMDKLLVSLESVGGAFGRGELITVDNEEYELVLVKNPAGFRMGLLSFEPDNAPVMIVINDEYADGKDVSWLWDVDFSKLKGKGVAVISGHRAYDMALRLVYSDIIQESETYIDLDIKKSLDKFKQISSQGRKRIYGTYTAMLEIRKILTGKSID